MTDTTNTPLGDEGLREDRITRLQKEVRRLREEANMDDRAAATSKNPDAAPVFAQWAIDKRERAKDIETLLASRNTASVPVGLPPITKGHARSFLRCRMHNRVGWYDYVPYSLSSAVSVMPCGCDGKFAEHIDEATFLSAAPDHPPVEQPSIPAGMVADEPCSLGVGCDEAGVCYADALGQPDKCGRKPVSTPRVTEIADIIRAYNPKPCGVEWPRNAAVAILQALSTEKQG